MPDNLPLIPVESGAWVDLYDLSGITVGQPLIVENVGVADLFLAVQAAQPPEDHKSYNILKRDDDIRLTNTLGDLGAWVFCNGAGGLISVAEREGFQPLLNSALHDGDGNPLNAYHDLDTDTYVLDVHVADVHNQIVNRHIHQHTLIETTLAVTSAVNDYQITVVSAAGFAVNDYLHINTTDFETTHPRINNIVGNVFTLDRRLDVAHLAGDTITKAIINMALAGQIGTMAVPQEYAMWPEPGLIFHITRILFAMEHGTAGDLGLFGDLAPLVNGVLIRVKINGQYGTLTNWKTNADIKTDMFDVEFDARSGGGGTWGTSGRGTFTETGAVLRLNGDTDDRLEIYVQDDITGLDSFTMKAQGHLEGG